ncbi:MAG: RluA family pseudouridine synthase [Bacteroidota bacterium]
MSDKQLIKHYSKPGDREREAYDEDTLFDHYTLSATANQRPLRVDVFLANLLPFTTRSKIKNASRTGSITVNGKAVKVSYKVRPNDVVKVMLPFPPVPSLEAEDIPLDIRYEDDALIILHKPSGMVVHPGLGHRTGTLVHGLLHHVANLPKQKGQVEGNTRPGLVHRLDKDTTGIMVIAKSEYAMAHLSKQFFDRTSDRSYLALVWGDVEQDEGTITAHVGRHTSDRKIYRAYPDGSKGKHAVTHYTVLERFGVLTLIQCKLETGRTHQIRVHLKYLGHPLFSDTAYGGSRILKGPPTKKYQQMIRNLMDLLPRQALHAKTLSITHPDSGERLAFDSDLPPDMAAAVQKLKRWVNSASEIG